MKVFYIPLFADMEGSRYEGERVQFHLAFTLDKGYEAYEVSRSEVQVLWQRASSIIISSVLSGGSGSKQRGRSFDRPTEMKQPADVMFPHFAHVQSSLCLRVGSPLMIRISYQAPLPIFEGSVGNPAIL